MTTYITSVATTILTTTIFRDWLEEQPPQIQKQVTAVVELLHQYGVALRELRPSAGNSPARVFYAFDPERMAVVLCGGSKHDSGDLYETAKAVALAEWTKHLAALAARKKPSKKGRRQ